MSDNFEIDQWNCLDDRNYLHVPISIPSASSRIDNLFFPLFKGIPTKNITEVVGLPGTGKTCFAMDLCINALIQDQSNAVVYIDTSSNFTIERFDQIFRAQESQSSIPFHDILNRMLVLPAVDIYEVFMQLTRFPSLLYEMSETKPNPKLIVIDNVAAPFKLITGLSMDRRIKIIEKLARDLRKISVRYNCAVLTVNQLTRRVQLSPDPINSPSDTPQYHLIPRLGQTWRNHIDSSINLIGEHETGRYAMLDKSNLLNEQLIDPSTIMRTKEKIKYKLTEEGFVEDNFIK